ncbi:hypothetical protein [Vogesella sp. XCS3]|uniref:hypothetical protein n=1 Tax=Vogesella sp. XCS3 TaxID=2877939 RepID=UPI001D0B1AC4|nr:hypothetical protein [Vogesella sp. XCS3]UDM18899.1 hypothetical protein LCH97_18695 [Vogesella sp. XCS3]
MTVIQHALGTLPRQEEIQSELAKLGFRMEPDLGVFSGGGHALMSIADDECVDPPNEHVYRLAFEWSVLEGAIPHTQEEIALAEELARARESKHALPKVATLRNTQPGF